MATLDALALFIKFCGNKAAKQGSLALAPLALFRGNLGRASAARGQRGMIDRYDLIVIP